MSENPRKLILPSDKLAVIEEYIPGEGTYADEHGYIRAARIGYLVANKNFKVITVIHPQRKPFIPKQGMIVLGVVTSVKEDLVFIDIIADKDGNPFPGKFTGVIHLSQASKTFIKTIEEAFKLSDIVLAKVLTDKIPPYQLTTKPPELGVIAATCSLCGTILVGRDENTLICPQCGNMEKRKIALNYLIKHLNKNKRS